MSIIVTWLDGREETINGDEITDDGKILIVFGRRDPQHNRAPIINVIPRDSIKMARRDGGGRIVTGLSSN